MNIKPTLIVLAAGIGSRFGGLKQMEPVGPHGESIIDYSVFDAVRAGFARVVFVINHKIESDFREMVGKKAEKLVDVEYVFQEIDDLPEGFSVPEGRTKPWGTAHALYAARKAVKSPFAVINSDDYYGTHSLKTASDFLLTARDDSLYRYAMIGYKLENTLTENGHVSRGVCSIGSDGLLREVVEHVHIERKDGGVAFSEDSGTSWTMLPAGSIASMNLFCFTQSFMLELEKRFPSFLQSKAINDPLKSEYFLPGVVNQLLEEGLATVRVLETPDKWYGVTYREDKPSVQQALANMAQNGIYPENLFA